MKTLIPDNWHTAIARRWQREITALAQEEQALQFLLDNVCGAKKRNPVTSALREHAKYSEHRIARLQGVAETLGLVVGSLTPSAPESGQSFIEDLLARLEQAAASLSTQIVGYGKLVIHAQLDGNFAGVILLKGNLSEHQAMHTLVTARLTEMAPLPVSVVRLGAV